MISPPHAAPPDLPLSTRTKCVWSGFSGAPFLDAASAAYGRVWPAQLPMDSRPFVTPHEKMPMSGKDDLYVRSALPTIFITPASAFETCATRLEGCQFFACHAKGRGAAAART